MAAPSEFGLIFDRLKRMQGKSCFNFKAMDEALFAELERLTEQGIERFRRESFS